MLQTLYRYMQIKQALFGDYPDYSKAVLMFIPDVFILQTMLFGIVSSDFKAIIHFRNRQEKKVHGFTNYRVYRR